MERSNLRHCEQKQSCSSRWLVNSPMRWPRKEATTRPWSELLFARLNLRSHRSDRRIPAREPRVMRRGFRLARVESDSRPSSVNRPPHFRGGEIAPPVSSRCGELSSAKSTNMRCSPTARIPTKRSFRCSAGTPSHASIRNVARLSCYSELRGVGSAKMYAVSPFGRMRTPRPNPTPIALCDATPGS